MSQETVPPVVGVQKVWRQPGFDILEHVLFLDGTRGVQTQHGEMIIRDLGHAFFRGPTKKGKGIIISIWNTQITRHCMLVIFCRVGRSARIFQSEWVDDPPPAGVIRTVKKI